MKEDTENTKRLNAGFWARLAAFRLEGSRVRWAVISVWQIAVLVMGIGYNGNANAAEDDLKQSATDVSDLKELDPEPYAAYLRESGKPPIKYVVEKFKLHDVVIVGEIHEVREVCEFYADLMGPVYHQAGVRYFAMEILKHKNTRLANQLVTAKHTTRNL